MNIVVAQSGGPTCAINASLLGVFKGRDEVAGYRYCFRLA